MPLLLHRAPPRPCRLDLKKYTPDGSGRLNDRRGPAAQEEKPLPAGTCFYFMPVSLRASASGIPPSVPTRER